MEKIAIIFLLSFFQSLTAQWSNDPNENTRVTRAALLPIMVSDGAGGAFIVYENDPGLLRQKYVQRVDRYGYVKFPGDGVMVSAPNKHQIPGGLVIADGENGIIISYDDFYSINQEPYTYSFPYLQRIDSTGKKLWGEMGVQVSSDTSSNIRAMCSDGSGGVFLLYRTRAFKDSALIYPLLLQHVNSSGEFFFGDKGIRLKENDHFDNEPVMVHDGQGGFLFTMLNYDKDTKEFDQSLHYLKNDGQERWQIHSKVLYANEKIIFMQDHIFITGAVVEYDIPSKDYFYHLRARVLDLNANLISPEEGFVIKDSLGYENYEAFPIYNSDIIVFYDKALTEFNVEIHAQRVTPTGAKLWGHNGLLVYPYDYCFNLDNIVYDHQHGVIAIWHDSRFNPDHEIFGKYIFSAQRITLDGKLMWPDSGVVITTQDAGLSRGGAVSDMAGGAVICWSEIGSDTRWGIFAQQISRNGNLGEVLTPTTIRTSSATGANDFNLYPLYPNPFNENVKIKFYIPQSTLVHLKVYDITGKEVVTLVKTNLADGRHEIEWNGQNSLGNQVNSGIYFIFLKAGGFVKSQKAILIK